MCIRDRYKGNYHSVIQVNIDLPIFADRAIDLACHEGYPGHHVYNVLLEKTLVRDRGWVEFSVYPLRSPQSLIAEGSANYGITALWTAAHYRVPVVFVILKNGTYGALRGFADLLDTGETPGLDVPGIDFVQIAQGYGVEARAVTTGEEFVLALESALDRPGPVLIEVTTAHLQFPELT